MTDRNTWYSPNKCAECGDELTCGDTVYTLLGKNFCAACVKYGRHIHDGESMGDSHLADDGDFSVSFQCREHNCVRLCSQKGEK